MSPKKDRNNEQAGPQAQDLQGPEIKKEKRKKGKQEDISLPDFVELAFRFSGLFLILITLIVAAVSFVSGASLLQIVMRTGITIIVMGVLLLILTSRISAGALEAAKRQIEDIESHSKDGIDTTGKIGQDIKA